MAFLHSQIELLFLRTLLISSRLARSKILPEDYIVLYRGQKLDFNAIGYSSNDEPISGVKFEWTAEDVERKNTRMRSMLDGRFEARELGEYIVRAKAKGIEAKVEVEVKKHEAFETLMRLEREKEKGDLEEINKLKKEKKYNSINISSKKEYKRKKKVGKETGSGQASMKRKSAGSANKRQARGPHAVSSENNPKRLPNMPRVFFRPANADGWDENNWWLADNPDQQIGSPPGSSPDVGAGNGNFQFSAPVVSLSGRGIDINLSLHYNSKLWNKNGNEMIYDADKGYPAPGWSLGFGKLVYVGKSGGCMLFGADGTRHSYTGTVTDYGIGGYTSVKFKGHSTDDSFIDYECQYNSISSSNGHLTGTAKLPNGTKISYDGDSYTNGQQTYPNRITDANGNYIQISYRLQRAPEISYITDTMGRVITFNYDASNRLISVSVPKLNGGVRTAVRLHYKTITLSPGFATGITTNTATNTPAVIDAIYYPGNKHGLLV